MMTGTAGMMRMMRPVWADGGFGGGEGERGGGGGGSGGGDGWKRAMVNGELINCELLMVGLAMAAGWTSNA